MRAVVVPAYGGPEVLSVRDVPEPRPGPGEVSVAVRFAGVNYTDVRNRRGDGLGVPPFIPGVEVSGTVREVGDGVTALRPGQAVAAFTRGHGYAEV
ncbi:MAG TPA: alcohol dehydrogenase catalytic domain-containing protein, partial [Streptosporangiaceae bacterium]|nr:alcohol dehydrogenase catalytic domain-containing protein [Streptosporangiaceae bacterium]